MIVVLVGYMASGKSTIGEILAKKLDYAFVDLDDYIEKREGQLVKEIFADKGEIYFRKKEASYLKEIINSKANLVLSLGGGTPCYSGNMDFLLKNEKVVSIYLKASVKNLVARLMNEKNTRPLISHLKTKEEFTEFIGKHLFERVQFYTQSNFTITTDDNSEAKILEDIIFKLF